MPEIALLLVIISIFILFVIAGITLKGGAFLTPILCLVSASILFMIISHESYKRGFSDGGKSVVCPACPQKADITVGSPTSNTFDSERRGLLLKDAGPDTLPVGEIIKRESVAQVNEKFIVFLRFPDNKTKVYELSRKPPKIFIKTDEGEYLGLPGL